MEPFNPLEHFSYPNYYCFSCRYDRQGSCRADIAEQCPNVLTAAFNYLTEYLTEQEVEEYLRYSLSDDLLAASMARKADIPLEDGRHLFNAFQFWATGLRS
jgi:hypothetical protein